MTRAIRQSILYSAIVGLRLPVTRRIHTIIISSPEIQSPNASFILPIRVSMNKESHTEPRYYYNFVLDHVPKVSTSVLVPPCLALLDNILQALFQHSSSLSVGPDFMRGVGNDIPRHQFLGNMREILLSLFPL